MNVHERRWIDRLIADADANNGLAPLDLEAFWRENDRGREDFFAADLAQCPFGAILTNECVFAELGLPEDHWRLQATTPEDRSWTLDTFKRYNDLAEKVVGRRLLWETPSDPERQWPAVKHLSDIFEGRSVWEGGPAGSWWLHGSASTPEELAALLDRVEKRLENLRDFLLPENWAEEKQRLTALGEKAPLYRGQRGPCTFACSIYGEENLLMLHYDDPGLMKRFSDAIRRAIFERARVFDEEAGFTPEAAPRGWWWFDDNSCLFNPEMYERFAMPIHRAVLGRYSPGPDDARYQHSDSAMGHLLPLLSELRLTGTNFGPTLTFAEIRRHLPRAVVQGQLAPFTYSRDERHNMVAEFLRDFEQARGTRGLDFTTSGSINNGSRLAGMRLLMAAVQRRGAFGTDLA